MASGLMQKAKQMDAMLVFLASKLTTPRLWGVALLIWISAIVPVRAASVNLRVAIEQDAPQVNVGSSSNAQVLDGMQRPIGEIQAMNGFTAQAKNGGVALDRWLSGAIWIVPENKNSVVWIGDRWYRGSVYVIPTGKGLTAINYVDLEQYLYSVLGAEMNGNWPQEALKAQAVAARSFALARQEGAYRNGSLFDVDDTTRTQVYNGVQSESAGTRQAVAATTGQVLSYNNRIVEGVFHSSAGGCTENAADVWGGSPSPYLVSVVNSYDQGAPVYQWSKTFSVSELSSHFNVGNVQRIEPTKTTPVCKRIKEMRIIGDRGQQIVSGDKVQDVLDLKSTLFAISPQFQPVASKGNVKPTIASFVVNGRGFGHGAGMSQWGAYNMARQGARYDQILQEYYKNTEIRPIAPQ